MEPMEPWPFAFFVILQSPQMFCKDWVTLPSRVVYGWTGGSAYYKITNVSDKTSEAGNENYCYELHPEVISDLPYDFKKVLESFP
jgi:hypothetical protein